MSGGTSNHGRVIAELTTQVNLALRNSPCAMYPSDVRIRVEATGLATYPDLSVVCRPRERHPEDPNAFTNPVLLAEVLSPSTEGYDRGEKFRHYRAIPSLRHYLLVSVTDVAVELFTRADDGTWVLSTYGPGDTVRIASLDIAIDVDSLYIDLDEPSDSPSP